MENNVNTNAYGEVLRGKMTKSNTGVRPITEKQLALLVSLKKKWTITFTQELSTLTRLQASEKIDAIIIGIKNGTIKQRVGYVSSNKPATPESEVTVTSDNSSVIVYVIIENLEGVLVKQFTGKTKEEACIKAVNKYSEDIKLFTTDLEEVVEEGRRMKNQREMAVRELQCNTVRELREIAKSYSVPEYSKYKKEDLCKVLYLHAHTMNKGA